MASHALVDASFKFHQHVIKSLMIDSLSVEVEQTPIFIHLPHLEILPGQAPTKRVAAIRE